MTNNSTKCSDSQLRHSPYDVSELNPLTRRPFDTVGHVVRKKDLHHKGRFKTTPTYQSPTAEEDHENDERFKPVVLHDDEAGFSECPPALVIGSVLVNLAAVEPTNAVCKHGETCQTTSSSVTDTNTLREHCSDLLSICIDCHSTGCTNLNQLMKFTLGHKMCCGRTFNLSCTIGESPSPTIHHHFTSISPSPSVKQPSGSRDSSGSSSTESIPSPGGRISTVLPSEELRCWGSTSSFCVNEEADGSLKFLRRPRSNSRSLVIGANLLSWISL